MSNPIEIHCSIKYDGERWTQEAEVYVDGRDLGGHICGEKSLESAIVGLRAEIRATTDILPPLRAGKPMTDKWLAWIRERLAL